MSLFKLLMWPVTKEYIHIHSIIMSSASTSRQEEASTQQATVGNTPSTQPQEVRAPHQAAPVSPPGAPTPSTPSNAAAGPTNNGRYFKPVIVAKPLTDICAAYQPEKTIKVSSYTQEGNYVITSPNADYIPEPFVGIVRVCMRSDYRYGENDPFQWPQVFTPGFEFLSVIRLPYSSPHPYESIWWTPNCETDFRPIEGGVFKSLGLLASASLARLDALVDAMTRHVEEHCRRLGVPDARLSRFNTAMVDARNRLLHFPATFRDTCFQVREVQRFWLLCRAVMDYTCISANVDPAQRTQLGFMGAFTTDPGVMQTLARGGIPVWFIRPRPTVSSTDVDNKMVQMKPPISVVQTPWQSNAPAVYSGLSGYNHLKAICAIKHMYLDVSQSPLLYRYDYRAQPSSTGEQQMVSQVGPSRTHGPKPTAPKASARKVPRTAGKMQVSNRKYC